MDSNIVSGLIGVGGTVVGCLLAIGYTIFQSNQSTIENDRKLLVSLKKDLDYIIHILHRDGREIGISIEILCEQLSSEPESKAMTLITDHKIFVKQKYLEHIGMLSKLRICFSEFESHFHKENSWGLTLRSIHDQFLWRKQYFEEISIREIIKPENKADLTEFLEKLSARNEGIYFCSLSLIEIIYDMQMVFRDKKRIREYRKEQLKKHQQESKW